MAKPFCCKWNAVPRPVLLIPKLSGGIIYGEDFQRSIDAEGFLMDLLIRPVMKNDINDLVQLSLLAWVPIFNSFERILGPSIYMLIWPDWKTSQREAIEEVCKNSDKTIVWVAELNGIVVGFLAYELDVEEKIGNVQLLGVHPDYQNRGIGTELNLFALRKMKESGMRMAKVETGGDSSHAPARRSYQKAGYTALPLVRYFKDL